MFDLQCRRLASRRVILVGFGLCILALWAHGIDRSCVRELMAQTEPTPVAGKPASGFQAVGFPTIAEPGVVASTATAPAAITWRESYGEGWRAAEHERRLLLLQLWTPSDRKAAEVWRRETTNTTALRERLEGYVLAHCDASQSATVADANAIGRHPAFAELRGRSGLAIVDLQSTGRSSYGRVISLVPAVGTGDATRFPSVASVQVLLDLPVGSLTQRTLIYAVRLHPERPRSTNGLSNPLLMEEAEKHSSYQASIGVQGHHAWDRRFHAINARLPSGAIAQEVCAESWPGQDLFAAAIECVHSWRQSSGHWSAVSGHQTFFGYDMKRGSNGVWYATGIFGRVRGL
ncbi:MAG: hypothetical protein ACKO38_00625 [Planctomycetota bacterium]